MKPTENDFTVGKQGDIQEDCYYREDTHHYIAVPKEWTEKQTEEFIKQISQDHEDAKELKIENASLADELQELGHKSKKDRRIVKRLEELDLETLDFDDVIRTKLKEILEGKK